MEELSELGERHQFLESQVEDVRTARRELHHVIRTLDEEIMQVFDSAFADVNEHFSTLVTSLFPGGTGRLSLTDPENLLDTGVEVEVRPAGRNVRRLSLLSGGERSLVALAYLFAVFRSRPSPFYLMDEVEAALDDVNLQRFLGLVHEFREGAQLIIVSHQKRTMEAADALYGVTMAPGGSSKVVSQKVPRHRSDGLDWSDGETGTLPGSETGLMAEPAAGAGLSGGSEPGEEVEAGFAGETEAEGAEAEPGAGPEAGPSGSAAVAGALRFSGPESPLSVLPGPVSVSPSEQGAQQVGATGPAVGPTTGPNGGAVARTGGDDGLEDDTDERFDNAPIGDRFVDSRPEAGHIVGTDQ
jgi:hypothetical protein